MSKQRDRQTDRQTDIFSFIYIDFAVTILLEYLNSKFYTAWMFLHGLWWFMILEDKKHPILDDPYANSSLYREISNNKSS